MRRNRAVSLIHDARDTDQVPCGVDASRQRPRAAQRAAGRPGAPPRCVHPLVLLVLLRLSLAKAGGGLEDLISYVPRRVGCPNTHDVRRDLVCPPYPAAVSVPGVMDIAYVP